MSQSSQSAEAKYFAALVASKEQLSPAGQDVLELIHQGYVCAPDEGPAWRAACEAGVDMSLVEDTLRMSPDARLREHQRALNQVLSLRKARLSHEPGG